jgi:hypothetical protein
MTELIELNADEQSQLDRSVTAIRDAREDYLSDKITRYEFVGIIGQHYCGAKDNVSITRFAQVVSKL